jgi:hypothetical protein
MIGQSIEPNSSGCDMPSTVLTPGITGLIANSPDRDAEIREFTGRRLMAHVGSIEDIEATYINGAIISIDGGPACRMPVAVRAEAGFKLKGVIH